MSERGTAAGVRKGERGRLEAEREKERGKKGRDRDVREWDVANSVEG